MPIENITPSQNPIFPALLGTRTPQRLKTSFWRFVSSTQNLMKSLLYLEKKVNGDEKNPALEEMFKKSPATNSSAKSGESASKNLSKTHDELKVESSDTAKEIEEDFDSLGSKIEDSIANALKRTGGKFESFADMAKTILGDISQVLISNMFSGFFADGGKLAPGKFGIVGENGPELAFAGNSPLNIMPDLPIEGNVTINMNVQTLDIESFRQSGSQIATDIARQIERVRRTCNWLIYWPRAVRPEIPDSSTRLKSKAW